MKLKDEIMFDVWCVAKGESADNCICVDATSPRRAAMKWARAYDTGTEEGARVADGCEEIVTVSDGMSSWEFIVSGRLLPDYHARQVKP